MISHKYKCIFIHIPKTAGQSIEHFFLNLHGLSWEKRAPLLLKYNPDPNAGPESLAHLTASEYVQLGHISEKKFLQYYKFAFVRNPWARLVSEYRYRTCYRNFTFTEFVMSGLPEPNPYSDKYRHIMPQYDFLYDINGKLLVDFVAKFENLQKDFHQVLKKLSLPLSDLPHINASSSKRGNLINKLKCLLITKNETTQKHWIDYYNKETREKVAELYAKDIKKFNYRFKT